jgi:hypothetical protein
MASFTAVKVKVVFMFNLNKHPENHRADHQAKAIELLCS